MFFKIIPEQDVSDQVIIFLKKYMMKFNLKIRKLLYIKAVCTFCNYFIYFHNKIKCWHPE